MDEDILGLSNYDPDGDVIEFVFEPDNPIRNRLPDELQEVIENTTSEENSDSDMGDSDVEYPVSEELDIAESRTVFLGPTAQFEGGGIEERIIVPVSEPNPDLVESVQPGVSFESESGEKDGQSSDGEGGRFRAWLWSLFQE